MSDSLRLSIPDLDDPESAADFYRVADAARDVDGYDPFNEQARLDVEAGRRTPLVASVWFGDGPWADQRGRTVGAAILGAGELDLVIDPVFRGKGYGTVALSGLLATARGELLAWSHGDHPAARALARRTGFEPVRTLLQLALELHDSEETARASSATSGTDTITTFRPGDDDAEWVALNARVFATHPEQGKMTVDDLRARQAESWFEADDFLIARDSEGRMVGYDWLKVEPGADEGEIYVIGVDADSAGSGLGRTLLNAGLDRLAARGCTSATLYVEADNERAVRLYRSAGFADRTVDVQYRRSL